jgi:metallo-beta-lactamase family protein
VSSSGPSDAAARLIVPAFAVGRTQQIVLLLHQLMDEKRIPAVPMFVDSPLAVDVTKTFRAHPECFDEETQSTSKRARIRSVSSA